MDKTEGENIMDMDKLVIVCNGKVKEAFNLQDGKAFDFLWDEDIESTWSYTTEDDKGLSIVTIYGFEPVDGAIDKLLDNRRKKNLTKLLNGIGVNVVSIEHFVVDSLEYEVVKNEIEGNTAKI